MICSLYVNIRMYADIYDHMQRRSLAICSLYVQIRMYACHMRKNVRFRKQEQRPPINLEEGGTPLSFYFLRESKNSNWE